MAIGTMATGILLATIWAGFEVIEFMYKREKEEFENS